MWGYKKDKTPLMEETPRHKKKAQPKKTKKSNHKHDYCVIIGDYLYRTHNYKTGQQEDTRRAMIMTKCSICGKTSYLRHKDEYGGYENMFKTPEQLMEKYPELEVVRFDGPPWK